MYFRKLAFGFGVITGATMSLFLPYMCKWVRNVKSVIEDQEKHGLENARKLKREIKEDVKKISKDINETISKTNKNDMKSQSQNKSSHKTK